MQPPQHLKRLDHLVDPAREGRCFRCLGRGHAVRDCRDPIACRLCCLPGHRQASCPLRRVQRPNLPGPGMFDCLVGDVWGEVPLWEHILDKIRTVCLDLTSLDAHRLVSGAIFIRRLSKADWRKLLGVTQQIPGGGGGGFNHLAETSFLGRGFRSSQSYQKAGGPRRSVRFPLVDSP